MVRKNVFSRLRKWVGSTLVVGLVVSGLTANFSASPIYASDPVIDLPKNISLSTASATSTDVTLEATTDKTVESSSSTVLLFKLGDPVPVDSSTAGVTHSFTVARPTTNSYDQYYTTVAGITSNLITVHSNTTGTWTLEITSNVNSFLTQDNAPTITWVTNQNIKTANPSLGVYIAEKSTGQVVYAGWNATTTASYQINKFYTEPYKEYVAYVASWVNTSVSSLNVSMLTNIKTVYNRIFIYRPPWTVQFTADRSTFSTSDPTPILTWETNQKIGSTANNYSVYIVNINTGQILDRTNFTTNFTYSYTITRFLTGDPVLFKAIVATRATSITNVSQLTNIQAESNILTY